MNSWAQDPCMQAGRQRNGDEVLNLQSDRGNEKERTDLRVRAKQLPNIGI